MMTSLDFYTLQFDSYFYRIQFGRSENVHDLGEEWQSYWAYGLYVAFL